MHNDLQVAKFRGVVWPRLPPAFIGTPPSSFELVSRIIARRRLVRVQIFIILVGEYIYGIHEYILE